MSQINPADVNAPPGGGANATVVASTQPTPPANPPTGNPPAPDPDALKLEPQAPAPAVTKTEPEASSLPDMGDPGLNVAADYFVNTLGLALDSPEIVEAAKGNYSYLEARIAQLGDKAKGADRFVTLAKESQARVADVQKAAAEAAVKTVYDAVGGESNWKAVQNYARSNLKPEQLSAASAVLSQGGFAATAMATYLMQMASGNPQVSIEGAAAVDPAAAVTQSLTAHAPLTREQYREEYKKLVAQYGITGAQKRPELAQLNARLVR